MREMDNGGWRLEHGGEKTAVAQIISFRRCTHFYFGITVSLLHQLYGGGEIDDADIARRKFVDCK